MDACSRLESRSALYARFDAQLRPQTRFFAAAALVNRVLARHFRLAAAIRVPCSLPFLDEVGAALEAHNRRYARALQRQTREGSDASLDHALVCAEQARLQRYVHTHRTRSPQQWDAIRRELNALLNGRHPAACLARYAVASGTVTRILRRVRAELRAELDFATEAHRIRIGLGLTELIRRETPGVQCASLR